MIRITRALRTSCMGDKEAAGGPFTQAGLLLGRVRGDVPGRFLRPGNSLRFHRTSGPAPTRILPEAEEASTAHVVPHRTTGSAPLRRVQLGGGPGTPVRPLAGRARRGALPARTPTATSCAAGFWRRSTFPAGRRLPRRGAARTRFRPRPPASSATSSTPATSTLEPEYYHETDLERYYRVKPLIWLWEMFDKSLLGENVHLGVKFRRILARRIFARCGRNFKAFHFVKLSFGYGLEGGGTTSSFTAMCSWTTAAGSGSATGRRSPTSRTCIPTVTTSATRATYALPAR